MCKQQQL